MSKTLVSIALLLALLFLMVGCESSVPMQEVGRREFEAVPNSILEEVLNPEVSLFIPEEFLGKKGIEDPSVVERINEAFALSEQTGYTIQYYGCKGCTDLACAAPDHYHWCPFGCKEVEHYHMRYQWKQFQ